MKRAGTFWLFAVSFLGVIGTGAAQSCDVSCTDYSPLCPSFKDPNFFASFPRFGQEGSTLEYPIYQYVPPTPDCKDIYYQLLCPQSCGQCTKCEITEAQLTPLATKIQSTQTSLAGISAELDKEKAATPELQRKADKCDAYVESQQVSDPGSSSGTSSSSSSGSTDDDVYKLAFKSTANQLTWQEFEALFRYGAVPGSYEHTGGRYHYRVPSFHFFWEDTTSVRLDVFDSEDTKAVSIFFDIPAHSTSARTTWFGIFDGNCAFVKGSSQNKDFTDISASCAKSMYKDSSGRPRFLLGQDANSDCDNIWFMLQDGINNLVCDYEKQMRYSGSLNNDYVVPFYNMLNVNGKMALKAASRIDLRISGAFTFSATSTNGYEKVFRYPSFAGVDVIDYYQSGTVDPTKDVSQMTAAAVNTENMFRLDNIEDKIKAASRVLLVLYDMSGNVAEALTFAGTGDFKSWFSDTNLISNINWNIYGPFKYFNIDGDSGNGRRFYIHETYNGCDNDPGYMLVACNRPNGDPPCTQYESMGDNSGDVKNYICKIIHTASNDRAKSKTYTLASAFEIFVK